MATSSEAFKSFRSAGVVVFANSKTESSSLPAGVRDVRAKGGSTIPMVFVTTADGSKGIDAVTYAAMKEDMRDAVKALRKTLEKADVLGGGAEAEDTETEETAAAESTENKLFAESQQWTNSDGKPITAAIKAVEGGQVKFIMADWRALDYALEKLSAESQKKISEIQAN